MPQPRDRDEGRVPQGPPIGSGGAGAGGAGGSVTAVLTPSRVIPSHRRHDRSVRVTLTLMDMAMAYMLLAMQFGMSLSATHPGGSTPGMPGM